MWTLTALTAQLCGALTWMTPLAVTLRLAIATLASVLEVPHCHPTATQNRENRRPATPRPQCGVVGSTSSRSQLWKNLFQVHDGCGNSVEQLSSTFPSTFSDGVVSDNHARGVSSYTGKTQYASGRPSPNPNCQMAQGGRALEVARPRISCECRPQEDGRTRCRRLAPSRCH